MKNKSVSKECNIVKKRSLDILLTLFETIISVILPLSGFIFTIIYFIVGGYVYNYPNMQDLALCPNGVWSYSKDK